MGLHARAESRIKAREAGSRGLIYLFENVRAVVMKEDSLSKLKGRLGGLIDHRKQRTETLAES